MPPARLPSTPPPRAWGWRRALPWMALLGLVLVAQSLLMALTLSYESTRAQEQVEQAAAELAQRLRQVFLRDLSALQAVAQSGTPPAWRELPAVTRVEWRTADRRLRAAFEAPGGAEGGEAALAPETDLACTRALNQSSAELSRSYFLPTGQGQGLEVTDLCLPVSSGGLFVARLALRPLLESAVPAELARRHESTLVESDGTRLARVGPLRGAGVYVAQRVVDLPGLAVQLRADSISGQPQWIPNLAIALVMGLTLALLATVVLLARDQRRRAGAEAALAESLAFRQAMENSMVTGLRARDLDGRVTHVNAAFCAMVGLDAEQIQHHWPPRYWPPEQVDEYLRRQQERQAHGRADARQGFETVFMRGNGERFPVLIFEAPLLDATGQQTGWMSTVLDVSEQRRVEELARQQQDRLQASARLATMGEMASLLSHELNQPLAAIASYATGSLNLLDDTQPDTPEQLRGALGRIATQAERAGRVIKSVHDFVRRREQAREWLAASVLLEAVLPLIRLQARKSGCRVQVQAPPGLRLQCDRTMVEQVLLNLSRNGIQAMEGATPVAARELGLSLRASAPGWVEIAVRDHGPGIAPDVARQLFTPFFTTRGEGMGLGLSLCRTVVEQHGGALHFENPPEGGCVFRFTLPGEALDGDLS